MKQVPSNFKLVTCTLALVLLNGCTTAPEEKLRRAASEGNLLRVETFLRQGVDVQAVNERGMTPLLLAVKNGHRDVVAVLLEHGASVNDRRPDGMTPLSLAVQQGHRDVVTLLLSKGADANGQVRMGGVTLLHVGAYRGDQAIIEVLLKHGGDKNARLSTGERPVDLALQQGHTALIPLLEP